MSEVKIWKPVAFNDQWLSADTSAFDSVAPSWKKYRATLQDYPEKYQSFIDQLKREHAIETGVIERLYDLDEGVTETLIKEGLVDSLVQHEDTKDPEHTMALIHDQFEALDGVFSFVKEERRLTTSFIKELHSVLTLHQLTTEALTPVGQIVQQSLLRGDYKKLPNNPRRLDGTIFEYCPPLNVPEEMEALLRIHEELTEKGVHVLIRAAFFHHAFTTIHPFQDGNGRVVRILVSMILIKEGYFPFTVVRNNRKNYIQALESADSDDFQPLVTILAENQVRAIRKALIEEKLSVIGTKLGDWPSDEAAKRREQRQLVLSELVKVLKVYSDDLLPKKLNRTVWLTQNEIGIDSSDVSSHAKISRLPFTGEWLKKHACISFKVNEDSYYIRFFVYNNDDKGQVSIGAKYESFVMRKDLSGLDNHRTYLPATSQVLSAESKDLKESISSRVDEIMLSALDEITKTIN